MKGLAIVAAFVATVAVAQDKLPLVKVVATGGTIANTPSGRLHAGEVADAIPALKKVARLEVEEVIRVGSSSITVENWLTLARRINEILAKEPEVKGVVVTHGSNTVEETGYFLSLTVRSEKPVVLTAAQRQFTTLSSDSPKNFLQAVRVAAKGIAVVMTNRGGMGRVTDTRAAEARPLIWGDNLTPPKARILLMLALTATRDRAELQRIFQTY